MAIEIPATKLVKGLFDRPIILDPTHSAVTLPAVTATQLNALGYCDPFLADPNCGNPGMGGCPPGYYMDLLGFCQPDPTSIIPGPIGGPTGIGGGSGPTVTVTGGDSDLITNNINNNINITDNGIQQVADAVNNAITNAAQNAADVARQAVSAVASGIKTLATNIWSGVQAAFGAVGDLLSGIANVVWDNLKSIFETIGSNIAGFLKNIREWITPIIQNIASVVDAISKQIQTINDTLIQPIANLYTQTIGTIANLTTAIERDLHQGLSGLLQIPTDIANGLGSLDAALQRTVQQLGVTNVENVKTGVDYLGEKFPTPFSAAMSKALGGNVTPDKINTTFSASVGLNSETFSQVSQEAVSGLGSLLSDVVNVVIGTFDGTLNKMHSDWSSVESVFTTLLDGLVGLLTTLTAMGAIANPLLDAASQRARSLVPTAKLDPSTVIEAMKRGFIDAKTGVAEIATNGLDATRVQVLQDLSVFVADVGQALDWWYRGIIADSDLSANMRAHGITDADQQAIKNASVRLPTVADLIRWMDFNLITQDEFMSNARILRYDDAQISAILSTYQQREPPELRATMDGLLNSSNAGFVDTTLKTLPPDAFLAAGKRAGYHSEYLQLIWDSHWELPNVDTFINMYFRGQRTLTEVEQRLAIANIPRELWSDVIEVRRPLLPFRSLAAFVKAGAITAEQGIKELAGHGFDLTHQNIIAKYLFPKADATNAKASTAAHSLSLANARSLWADGALTDAQYVAVLESHGFDSDMAQAQLKADAIAEHIKSQKKTIADYTAQVLAGQMTIDDATQQLTLQHFTSAQVSKFQLEVAKAQKTSAKIPTAADLKAFLKAGYITLDDYKNYLHQYLGWNEPWLSLFIAMETPPSTPTA